MPPGNFSNISLPEAHFPAIWKRNLLAMTHTHSNHSKKKWYSGRICLFHYTAIPTSKHCCSSQSLLFSYSYKLTQTYKLMKSETDKFSPPVQAEADFHIWNFWYVNAFECISWLYLEWKLNWKKVFFQFPSLHQNI